MSACLLHMTDCHLFADPQAEIRGIRTRDTFERVLAAIGPLEPTADRLIITGDLTHDEQPATYALLNGRLEPWLPKLRVLPGNHDDRSLMRAAFSDRVTPLGDRNVFVDDVGGWRLIGLDSHIPGQLSGELGDDQRDWLEATLDENSEMPTSLFLHHPPLSIGSDWLDRIRLQDATELGRLLKTRPQVRAICCGHIHQEFCGDLEGAMVLATPSTGVQFRPGTPLLEVDAASPGVRVVELCDDARVRSRVIRVP